MHYFFHCLHCSNTFLNMGSGVASTVTPWAVTPGQGGWGKVLNSVPFLILELGCDSRGLVLASKEPSVLTGLMLIIQSGSVHSLISPTPVPAGKLWEVYSIHLFTHILVCILLWFADFKLPPCMSQVWFFRGPWVIVEKMLNSRTFQLRLLLYKLCSLAAERDLPYICYQSFTPFDTVIRKR